MSRYRSWQPQATSSSRAHRLTPRWRGALVSSCGACTRANFRQRRARGTAGPWATANLNDTTKRQALAKQYIDGAVLYGMDGLNLDVEYDGSVRSKAWYQEHARLLTLFTCELRAMIHSLSYVPDR